MKTYKAAWAKYREYLKTRNKATLAIAQRLAKLALRHEIIANGIYTRVEMEAISRGAL